MIFEIIHTTQFRVFKFASSIINRGYLVFSNLNITVVNVLDMSNELDVTIKRSITNILK
jgi:hypothetical protein